MKVFITSLFLTLTIGVYSLPKDTLYTLHFISSEDSSPLLFAHVVAINQGITISSWEADIDGFITIKRKEINHYPDAKIFLSYAGFGKVSFGTDTLLAN